MPVAVPLPRLTCESSNGIRPVCSSDATTLVTLWSASCPTCLAELREWSRDIHRLRAAKFEVIALNVDSLLESAEGKAVDEAAIRDRAERQFQQLSVPFQLGFANRDLMRRLEALQLHLFDNSHPLLLPSSLLIDKNGSLGAFYRGAISFEQIADDLRALEMSRSDRVAYALPFVGRWRAQLGSPNVPAIGNAFARAGYPDDLLEIYEAAIRGEPQNVDARDQYARQLIQRGQFRASLDQRQRISELAPIGSRTGWSGVRSSCTWASSRRRLSHYGM